VAGGLTFSAISAGYQHTCALTPAGEAYCWGSGVSGQLGDGRLATSHRPVPVAGGLLFASITAGYAHTCALTLTGDAYCWGAHTGVTTNWGVPQLVAGGRAYSAIAAGSDHTCALTPAGQAFCWGVGIDGRLGNGSSTGIFTTPVAVLDGHTFFAITADADRSCALNQRGQAYCWGGQPLGDGSDRWQTRPVPVEGGHTFVHIAGGGGHTCATTDSGEAYCWGGGRRGALGRGDILYQYVPPGPVHGDLLFASGSPNPAGSHTCGITLAGRAYCWGWGLYGQLGNGGDSIETRPVPVTFPVPASAAVGGAGGSVGAK
jgi:alpha-tubulin suppressor-like RCC1 family protein